MKKWVIIRISANSEQQHINVALPATEYDVRDAMQKARIQDDLEHSKYEIIECEIFPALEKNQLEPTTLAELNFLVERLFSLNKDEETVLRALAEKMVKKTDISTTIRVKDVINYTYHLGEVPLISKVANDEELGEAIMENDALQKRMNMPKESLELMDKATLGKNFRVRVGGVLEGGKYVLTNEYPYEEVYDGTNLPTQNDKGKFVFRLEIVAADKVGVKAKTTGDWINLPIKKELANVVAEKYGFDCIEKSVFLGFESVIPQIERWSLLSLEEFDKLNELASIISGFSWESEVKFKAILERERLVDIGKILDVAMSLEEYEIDTNVSTGDEYIKAYIRKNILYDFDMSWLGRDNAIQNGVALLKITGAKITEYGVVSKRGEELYPQHLKYDKSQYLQYRFCPIVVCGKHGLFSGNRIIGKALPDGIYKYEFQGDRNESFLIIAKDISANFTGTVLFKEMLDLGKKGYHVLQKGDYPEFSNCSMTLQTYMTHSEDMGETPASSGMEQKI